MRVQCLVPSSQVRERQRSIPAGTIFPSAAPLPWNGKHHEFTLLSLSSAQFPGMGASWRACPKRPTSSRPWQTVPVSSTTTHAIVPFYRSNHVLYVSILV